MSLVSQSANRKSAKRKKYMVLKSQIRIFPHLRKVRKSNKKFKSEFADLRNLFLVRQPLLTSQLKSGEGQVDKVRVSLCGLTEMFLNVVIS